jgi:hypothetical protein
MMQESAGKDAKSPRQSSGFGFDLKQFGKFIGMFHCVFTLTFVLIHVIIYRCLPKNR